MAKYKSLLKTVSLKTAGGRRKCYHDKKHSINKGDPVFEIKDGPMRASGYCIKCALKITENSKKILAELEKQLNAHLEG